jgi:hypothetical protein
MAYVSYVTCSDSFPSLQGSGSFSGLDVTESEAFV